MPRVTAPVDLPPLVAALASRAVAAALAVPGKTAPPVWDWEIVGKNKQQRRRTVNALLAAGYIRLVALDSDQYVQTGRAYAEAPSVPPDLDAVHRQQWGDDGRHNMATEPWVMADRLSVGETKFVLENRDAFWWAVAPKTRCAHWGGGSRPIVRCSLAAAAAGCGSVGVVVLGSADLAAAVRARHLDRLFAEHYPRQLAWGLARQHRISEGDEAAAALQDALHGERGLFSADTPPRTDWHRAVPERLDALRARIARDQARINYLCALATGVAEAGGWDAVGARYAADLRAEIAREHPETPAGPEGPA